MLRKADFFIDDVWVSPVSPRDAEVINPATEQAYATISMGSKEDVDLAVAAAQPMIAECLTSLRQSRAKWELQFPCHAARKRQ